MDAPVPVNATFTMASTRCQSAINLDIPRRGGAHPHISRRIKKAGLDSSHFRDELGSVSDACEQFDRDVLAAAADDAKSMSEIPRRLGVPPIALPELSFADSEFRRPQPGTGCRP
jgi:hypothetical protein